MTAINGLHQLGQAEAAYQLALWLAVVELNPEDDMKRLRRPGPVFDGFIIA